MSSVTKYMLLYLENKIEKIEVFSSSFMRLSPQKATHAISQCLMSVFFSVIH